MNPHALLAGATDAMTRVLAFDEPADTQVAQCLREHRALGPRERQWVSDAVFRVLRALPWHAAWTALPPAAPGRARRLVLLGLLATVAPGGRAAGPGLAAAVPVDDRAWFESLESRVAELLAGPPEDEPQQPAWLLPLLDDALAAGPADADAERARLCRALRQGAPLDLRVNVHKARRADVQRALVAAGIEATPTPWSPWGLRLSGKPSLKGLPAFESGAIEVQDEGSQLLALLLGARRGETVADFCAGAGGKTLALGAAMRNQGRLYAFDTRARRLEALAPRLARSGLDIVSTLVLKDEHDERLQRLAGKLDRVLVDAPCSGLGTLRRSPDLQWRLQPSDLAPLPALQASLLQAAARLLKPGGTLVYATCSLLRAENEAVALAFGQSRPDMQAMEASAVLARAGLDDAGALCRDGQLRLWPHRHHTDGFFAAIWQKRH